MPKRKTVSLTLTHACNLNCIYCYEGFKENKSMPLDIAKSSLLKHLNNSDEFDEVEIDLAGGEPFIKSEMIIDLCEWTWEKQWPKPYIFFATTNGTMLSDKMKKWLADHSNKIYLSLSLDGTPDMHNINRSNSYDKIDINFFKTNWPDQPVKMTVSDKTLDRLSEGIKFISQNDFDIEVNLAYGVNWSDPINLEIFSQQLDYLIDYYVENPNVKVCSLFDMQIVRIFAPIEKKKWCGVGTDMVTIDIDGKEYPCHLFQPISIGEKSNDADKIDFTDTASLIDPNCNSCILLSICPTCYGVNYFENIDPAIRNKDLCNLSKIRAMACSYYEAKKLLKNINCTGIDDYDKQLKIRAIELIQDTFKDIKFSN